MHDTYRSKAAIPKDMRLEPIERVYYLDQKDIFYN